MPWISISMFGSAKPVTVIAALEGEVFAEYFGSDFSHPRRVAGIGEKDGHRDNVLQGRPGLFQRRFNALEGLAHLCVEVAGERIASRVLLTRVAGDPDDLACLRDHCWGERTRLLPCPPYE
jgi:hypothetical protein